MNPSATVNANVGFVPAKKMGTITHITVDELQKGAKIKPANNGFKRQ
jgi:hypothetical protein